jgi:GT2 family glycosyltransferase
VDVSIIIVNYNTYQYTCKCIESVIKYTKGLSYEIILVDNASTECDPAKFTQAFPDIQLIVSPDNKGFTGGNNLGIKRAKGDFILLLNSDTELTENSIATCFTFLKEHGDVGVVSCKLLFPDGTVQKQCQRFPSIGRTYIELCRLHKLMPQAMRGRVMQRNFFDHLSSIYTDSVWGAFFMFPPKVLDNFEGKVLPGDIFMYAEDLLWCLLIKRSGCKIYYDAETSVIHHLGVSSRSDTLQFKHQNEYDIMVKYYGKPYAKVLMLLRWKLYSTQLSNWAYYKPMRIISWNLLSKGRVA